MSAEKTPISIAFSIAYPQPICRCRSHLIVHERSDIWRFYCHVCRQKIDRVTVDAADRLFFQEADIDGDAKNQRQGK